MKGKKRTIIGLLVMVAIGCGIYFLVAFCSGTSKGQFVSVNQAGSKTLTVEQKVQDFDYLYEVLKNNYPYFEVNKRMNGTDWLSNKAAYEDRVRKIKNDEDFANEVNLILRDLHNGHTGILDKDFYDYAFKAYKGFENNGNAWLDILDDDVVKARYAGMKSTGNRRNLSGAAPVTKDNVKIDIIEQNNLAYMKVKSFNTFNKDCDREQIRSFLTKVKDYKALIIDIRGNGGGDERYWSEVLAPMLVDKELKLDTYHLQRGGDYAEKFLISKGFRYENLSPIEELKKEDLKCAPPETFRDFKYFAKAPRIVEPNNPVGFKGKVFLLVDHGVYSSSEAFAVFCKGTGFATLVGERTGGDGIGSDPLFVKLPNSGLVVRFSGAMGLTNEGKCNEEFKTEPDVLVDAKVGNAYEEDQAIQKVRELIK